MKKYRNSAFLVLAALIWGIAFVAQSTGGDAIGPWAFNCIRMIVGAISIAIFIPIMDKLKMTKTATSPTPLDKKILLKGGIICGCIAFFATNLQQLGITAGASAGKAGFLTTCYVVLVPVLAIFLKKKCGWNVWVSVVFAIIGLYLLCMKGSFSLELPDLLLILCALSFSVHILTIDHYSPMVDGVRLSCIQFIVCSILTAIPAFFVDMHHSIDGVRAWLAAFPADAWIAILYAGVMSCSIAYTLQIVGQEGVNPTVASLLMSLESVFSALAGAVILGERMSGRETWGCVLIFIAVIFAQLPLSAMMKKKSAAG
ncbi:MAG: DMT family transporter [Lachnospiraceae bacterium]|nr:DMT family transporter [Lachnospiraceae bacterium]